MKKFIFRLAIGILVLLYGVLGLYFEEVSMTRRLAKVKKFESELSKFLE